jgi:hypothetical protein
MNAIEAMVQQQVATNHTAVGALDLPAGFNALCSDALRKSNDADKAVEASKGKWVSLSEVLYDAEWRVASLDGKTLVGKQNRQTLRDGMVASWPNAKERAQLLADPNTLDDDVKKRVKKIRMGFGPKFALIEKYLTELEAGANGDETETETETKSENSEITKLRKAIESAVKYAGKLEGLSDAAGKPVDLVVLANDLKAILGRLPV